MQEVEQEPPSNETQPQRALKNDLPNINSGHTEDHAALQPGKPTETPLLMLASRQPW